MVFPSSFSIGPVDQALFDPADQNVDQGGHKADDDDAGQNAAVIRKALVFLDKVADTQVDAQHLRAAETHERTPKAPGNALDDTGHAVGKDDLEEHPHGADAHGPGRFDNGGVDLSHPAHRPLKGRPEDSEEDHRNGRLPEGGQEHDEVGGKHEGRDQCDDLGDGQQDFPDTGHPARQQAQDRAEHSGCQETPEEQPQGTPDVRQDLLRLFHIHMEQALRRRDQQIIMDKSQLERQLPQEEKAKEEDGDIRRALFLRRQEIQGIGHKSCRKHDDVGAAVIVPGMCGVVGQGQGQDHIEDKKCRRSKYLGNRKALF